MAENTVLPQIGLSTQILNEITSALMLVSFRGDILFSNREANRILGIPDHANKELSLNDFDWPLAFEESKSLSSLYQEVRKSVEHQTPSFFHACELRNNRGSIWLSLKIDFHLDENDEKNCLVVSFSDITEIKSKDRQLKLHAEVFRAAGEAVAITNEELCVIDVNQAYCDITEYSRDEVIDKEIHLLKSLKNDPEVFRLMEQKLEDSGFWQGELLHRRRTGEKFPVLLSLSRIQDSISNTTHYIAVFSDVTELRLARERLDFLAYHDTLTSLPNRRMCQIRYQHSVERAKRNNLKISMLFIDLDEFKMINDSLGHGKGDFLLKQFAGRLKKIVRMQDTVARLGGDEFLVILEDLEDSEQSSLVARKILTSLESSFELGEFERFINASIGISLFPDDGSTFEELLKHSDAAMYNAKSSGRNQYKFYRAEISERVQRRSQLEFELRNALENQQFHLYYQPQINISTGELIGAEALLRWSDRNGNPISPMEFIPIVENLGLIVPIGRWVIGEALRQVKLWRSQGLKIPKVAVNVSAVQLRHDDLVTYLTSAVEETGMSPTDLEVEITESMYVDSEETPLVISQIKDLNFSLALDDFGTGYSSLSYLTRLPFHKIKLDRSFVTNVPGDLSSESMVRSLVALAKTLGFRIIAEGVEEPEQLFFLAKHGCEEAQGFFIGKPVPAHGFAEMMNTFYQTSHWIFEKINAQDY